MKRQKLVTSIKVTEAEREAWKSKAGADGYSMAEVIRAYMNGYATGVIPLPPLVPRPQTREAA